MSVPTAPDSGPVQPSQRRRLVVGCAMWAHRGWQGRFLPRRLTAVEQLRAYAARLGGVEGNTTFYALPSADTVGQWAAATPDSFRMVCKLPREVTHERRLGDVRVAMRHFLDAIEPLGPRARQVAVQLPATFAPADIDTLDRFLQRMPAEHRCAVEVRHPDFFVDGPSRSRLLRTLMAHGAELVTLDARVLFATPPTSAAERETWRVKPRLPVIPVALTGQPVVRFIGRDDDAATIAGWEPWLDVVTSWLDEGRTPSFFVHTPDNVQAPTLATEFHRLVADRVHGLAGPGAAADMGDDSAAHASAVFGNDRSDPQLF